MGRDAGSGGRFTSRSTWALIGALFALVVALALCLDRFHNGDFYLSLVSGRFVAQHGFVEHYPFATIAKGGTWLNQQWLSELAFFRVAQVLGPSGLAILYAFLITAPRRFCSGSAGVRGGRCWSRWRPSTSPGCSR